MSRQRVAVLGAGIQGVCTALLLSRQGHHITLIDRAPACMLGASRMGEGKIHLGLVYANDLDFRTPALMLRGSLAFASVIERCVGRVVHWGALSSRPFTYVIARDSMVSPERLLDTYERLQGVYREALGGSDATYLGGRPDRLWCEGSPGAAGFLDRDHVSRTVDTVEVAIDPRMLRQQLGRAVEDLPIKKMFGHVVESVVRTPSGFKVGGVDGGGQAFAHEADLVVNCLWDGRLAVDRSLGIDPPRKWIYRLKYRLLGPLPASLTGMPSFTVVLGAYGDAVVYPGGRLYVSWYPACMRGWSTALVPPSSWTAARDGAIDACLAASVTRETLDGFSSIIPGLQESRVDEVDAGIIVAWGETDIEDPGSVLHTRADIGVHAYDGYYSIDTGKLTCAPLFASELAAVIGHA